jgi:hypothetical protein
MFIPFQTTVWCKNLERALHILLIVEPIRLYRQIKLDCFVIPCTLMSNIIITNKNKEIEIVLNK